MNIIHIAAELAPIAKVGGLGDVVYGLSRKTHSQGHPTKVFLPKYDILEWNEIENLTCLETRFASHYDQKKWENCVWKGTVAGLEVYFLEPLHPSHYFSRGCIYGCEDDVDRFLYFSAAALEFVRQVGGFDVVHIHDWQTAAIAPLANRLRNQNGKKIPPIVFTIHNMDYQGRCAPGILRKIGLETEHYYTPQLMQDSVYPEALNLLRGGILYSDFVTTVSPNYCRETKETFLGEGLEKLLLDQSHKYTGILNGIDYDYWNPETDKYLPAHYTVRKADGQPLTIDRKGYIKKILRDRLLLDEVHRPIVCCISRLVPQKGVEIIKHAMHTVVEKGGQFVLLGSSPVPSLDAEFHQLKHTYRDHPHISLNLQHQELLAHLIFAGSDMLIAPSNFEPCGLTQMIALRYGTLPIVRVTGGLKDSIYDVDYDEPTKDKAVGYTFLEPTPEAFDRALDRAITCWLHHPDRWRKFVTEGMTHDFSWTKPAAQYLEVYQKL